MRVGIGIVIVFLAGATTWWWLAPSAPPTLPPIDLSLFSEIEVADADSEVVGDWGNGKLIPMRETHFLTGSVAGSSTDPTQLRFYERLVFRDRLDNLREKNHCHFRIRLKGAAAQSGQIGDLVLLLSTDKDKKVLRFERIAGALASEPFILVDAYRPPAVAGLHELLMGLNEKGYDVRILRRKQ